MDTLTRAAIVKAASEKIIKGATAELLPSGDQPYPVDVTVRITGTITKGEEYEAVIRPAIPIYDVLVAMLDEAGCVQQGTFDRAYARVAGGFKAEADVKEWAKAALSKLDDLGVKNCTGKTTASLAVEAIAGEAAPYAVESEIEAPVEA